MKINIGLPLVFILAHREGWEKFAVGMWEGKFPKMGETMTQNIRALSYQLRSHISAT